MKLLIDTNVILDVMLKRIPYYSDGVEILKLAGKDEFSLFVSASAVTDIYYICRKKMGDNEEAKEALNKLLRIVSVAGVSEDEIRNALDLEWKDFEDCVQYSVAYLQHMDGIITRNTSDFSESELQVWEPAEFLKDVYNRG